MNKDKDKIIYQKEMRKGYLIENKRTTKKKHSLMINGILYILSNYIQNIIH